MCFHCQNPPCVKACPNQAITKDEKYGAVLVDQSKCTGNRKCFKACPYGSPQFESDEPGEKVSKCNMCVDRLKEGLSPICVLSCSLRALEFGPIDELRKKYGNNAVHTSPYRVAGLLGEDFVIPIKQDGQHANKAFIPSVVFKPQDPKKQILPYDAKKALNLWQKRCPDNGENLPDIFRNPEDVIEETPGAMGRNKLVLKPKNTEELMFYTTDDE